MAGEIRNIKRYRQLYDHSNWHRQLPRGITPSDIDVVFDNKQHARILFCDFSVTCRLWSEKDFGQRMMYQQLLRTNNYANACALCFHHVPPEEEIDTVNDVLSFHVMRIINRDGFVSLHPSAEGYYDGSKWFDFVKCFYGLDNELGDW